MDPLLGGCGGQGKSYILEVMLPQMTFDEQE